jgi:hypothetical protein
MARFRPALSIDEHTMPAILLLLLGTLAAAAAGPVFCQVALRQRLCYDVLFIESYVFCHHYCPLSWLIPDLRFVISPMFYTALGSGLIDHSQNMTAAAMQIAEK